jgi:hypothetical protein
MARYHEVTYGLFSHTFTMERPSEYAVQNLDTGQSVDLPREVGHPDDFWPTNSQVVVLEGNHLMAISWQGQLLWHRRIFEAKEMVEPGISIARLIGDQNGAVLLTAVGDASVNGVEIPYLRGLAVSPNGQLEASTLILDPFQATSPYEEDIHPVYVAGHPLAVVSFSRSRGIGVRTQVYDLSDPSGKPIADLDSSASPSPWWVWGAVAKRDRLVVGLGNGAVATFEVQEVHP